MPSDPLRRAARFAGGLLLCVGLCVALHGALSLLGGNGFEWYLRTERGPHDLEGARAGLPIVPDTPARMWSEVLAGIALLLSGAALRRKAASAP